MGDNCKYDGVNNYDAEVVDFLKDKTFIKVCPECLGGLGIPRVPSEIVGDRVINKENIDVTCEYTQGALKTLTIAKENDCQIIDIINEDSEFFGIGPAEFLYLEKNAKLVVTDSFHSCVFSIIFSTPFVVFKRDDKKLKSMHSRIETLLNTFNLQSRIFEDEITPEMAKIEDYSNATKILIEKREESLNHFKKIFHKN